MHPAAILPAFTLLWRKYSKRLEVIIDPCIIHGCIPGEEGKRKARVAGSEYAPLHAAPHYICHLDSAF